MSCEAMAKVKKNGKYTYIISKHISGDDWTFSFIDSVIRAKGKVPTDFDGGCWEGTDEFKDDDFYYDVDFDKQEVRLKGFHITTIEEIKKDGYGVFEKDGKWFIDYDPEDKKDPVIDEIPFENRIDEKYLEKTIYTFDEFYQAKKDLENIILDYYDKGIQYVFYKGLDRLINFDFYF